MTRLAARPERNVGEIVAHLRGFELDLYRFDAAPVSRLGDLCFEG